MLDIIYKGLIIGLCVSIPVGPIAVLCIQRTLNRGKYHGFATGLGAATSDLVYASLAAFSLSFIINFVEKNQFIIEIIGVVIVCIFGYFITRNNPVKNISTPDTKKESYFQDFATSFGLTITNPLIIFLFITFFAKFKFIDADSSWQQVVVGLLFIIIGASLWWFFLTSIVSLFREKFNVRGLWLVNKIAGYGLMIIALVGLALSLIRQLLI